MLAAYWKLQRPFSRILRTTTSSARTYDASELSVLIENVKSRNCGTRALRNHACYRCHVAGGSPLCIVTAETSCVVEGSVVVGNISCSGSLVRGSMTSASTALACGHCLHCSPFGTQLHEPPAEPWMSPM